MLTLADLFDPADLRHALNERLVVARKHPTNALTILNYTERCQYERGLWSPVTLACRGLIHDDQGRVVARPFPKFFNHGQAEAPDIDLAAPCLVTDKLDGSLGILYRQEVGYALATRGSFDSEQARHATRLWWDRYSEVPVPIGWTLLFEIIFPQNRIVLDYGDQNDLVLLGAVEIATGRSVGPDHPILETWPGPRADVMPYRTVAEALAAPPRPNAEGLVLHLTDTDERVKIKQEDYVELHRIVTGLNERAVWRHVADGKPVSDLLAALPDEFHEWVAEVAERLTVEVDTAATAVERTFAEIVTNLPPDHTRKDFAMAAKASPLAPHLFCRLDNKDYRARLWDAAKPSAHLGPRGLAPTAEAA